MSKRHRIRLEQLQVGTPLPVDVYDASDRLLLRHGNVICNEEQLQRLVRLGLFSEVPLPAVPQGIPHSTFEDARDSDFDGSLVQEAPTCKARISVYAEVVTAALRLEALLESPAANPFFVAEIEELARTLQKVCSVDADAALAHIMFARDVHYPVRQQINVALVTAVLLERTRNEPERTHAAVCAALTMNLTIQPLQEVLYHQQAMTSEQSKAITAHPAAARALLEQLGVQNEIWLTLVEQHHELVDGSGYPNRLTGSAILSEALVIGMADRYCAAVTERGYREAVAPDVAIGFMRKKGGSAPDQALLSALVHWIGMYPPGTIVELANQDIAVVARRLQDPQHPLVYSVLGRDLDRFSAPRKRLTGKLPQFHIARVLPRTAIDFPIDPEALWPGAVVAETVA